LEIVECVEDIPAFASEQEEADFWQTHRFNDALLDAAPPYTEEEATPARPSAAIALRIDPLLLTRLRRLATQRGVPYQRLLKQFVEERVVEEEAVALAPAPDPALVRELARSMARRARELERDALRLTSAS
jgi:predicted DNA binding CopG/RHH family protein